jgi:hypothetical protein
MAGCRVSGTCPMHLVERAKQLVAVIRHPRCPLMLMVMLVTPLAVYASSLTSHRHIMLAGGPPWLPDSPRPS